MWITCRWPNRLSNNHSGIRRGCCVPCRCCRSLVVLTEGHDLRPSRTGISAPEFCEIEEQGGLIVDCETCLYAPGRKVDTFHFDELQLSESAREGAISEALRRLPREVFRTVVTWLILPVVICLSQRLSHACLSINKFVL